MLTPRDLEGLCVMLPAFATQDAGRLDVTDTVDLDLVARAVDRAIDEGVDSIAATMTSGEFYTLLDDEQEHLWRTTVEVARGRVPVLAGCVTTSTRSTLRRIAAARGVGVDGIAVGVPHYVPATVDNAVQFVLDVATSFPETPFMIYHNPPLHRVRLPVDAVEFVARQANVIAIKDSHRELAEFEQLATLTSGRLTVLCHEAQLGDLAPRGAGGFWSMSYWLGPAPLLELRRRFLLRDWSGVAAVSSDLAEFWREIDPLTASDPSAAMERAIVVLRLAANHAGYCNIGPLRPPFRVVSPEIETAARDAASRWRHLVARYEPLDAP